jgi:hypothetical protein
MLRHPHAQFAICQGKSQVQTPRCEGSNSLLRSSFTSSWHCCHREVRFRSSVKMIDSEISFMGLRFC